VLANSRHPAFCSVRCSPALASSTTPKRQPRHATKPSNYRPLTNSNGNTQVQAPAEALGK